jgi:hypothetical protein
MASKRELIEPHKGDKRYVRRDERGRISNHPNINFHRPTCQREPRAQRVSGRLEVGPQAGCVIRANPAACSDRPRRNLWFCDCGTVLLNNRKE